MQAVRTGLIGTAVLALALGSAPPAAAENHEVNLGFFGVSTNIDTRELGLPVYPGATLHRKQRNEDSSAKVWAGLGSFGFKVMAIELDSADPPAKIAAWYRPMLAKFGEVLDCSAGAARFTGKEDDFLNCRSDHPRPGEFLLKSGKHYQMHVVGVEHEGAGSKIALVFVSLRGIGE